jgi:hypothetical protein
MTGASAGPQLLGEAIRYLIASHPRPLAWLRQPVPVSVPVHRAALRDALLAYATAPVHCQRGSSNRPTSLPACCPLRVVLTRYAILLKGQPGRLE